MSDHHQSTRGSTISDLIASLESHALYEVLPWLGHPRLLRWIRSSSSQLTRGAQGADAMRLSLIKRLRAAHQRDYERARVSLDELESILIEIDRAHLKSHSGEVSGAEVDSK